MPQYSTASLEKLKTSKLYFKHALIGTRLGRIAEELRWLATLPRRLRYPELADMYLESQRIQVVLKAMIKPHFNCIDIGAHIGSVLAEICKLAPHGDHAAFEPSRQKVKWLRKKFPHVLIKEAAVAAANGKAVFYEDLESPAFSGLRKPIRKSVFRNYEVEVVNLDDQMQADRNIDFIKIDVEGAELLALRGAENLLARCRPTVLFECARGIQLEKFDYQRYELYEFFIDRDYDVYSIGDFVYGRAPMTDTAFQQADVYPYRGFNFLAVPVGTEVPALL